MDETRSSASPEEFEPRVREIKRGAVTIPARLRRKLGWEDGTLLGFRIVDKVLVVRRVKVEPLGEGE